MVLACRHRFCGACLARCAAHDLSSCPTCRRPHELDPDALRRRLGAYRRDVLPHYMLLYLDLLLSKVGGKGDAPDVLGGMFGQ